MNAVIYARFSPRPNAEDCDSNKGQISACKAYCRSKDIVVHSVHEDSGISGNDMHRPGLWNAVNALGRGDILLSVRPDRLARDVYISELVHREARKVSASVNFVEGNYSDSPQDKMVRQFFQAIAEYEREMIGIRTSLAMQRKMKAGQMMSKHPPYGYMVDPQDLTMMIEEPNEQMAVERLKELRGVGFSFAKICKKLTAEGFEARGKGWHPQTIKRIHDRRRR